MTGIDKGLIVMRIAYNTRNDLDLEQALRDLVRYNCTANEIFENCPTLTMKRDIKAKLIALGLKPIVVK